jgi:hypothetical protein
MKWKSKHFLTRETMKKLQGVGGRLVTWWRSWWRLVEVGGGDSSVQFRPRLMINYYLKKNNQKWRWDHFYFNILRRLETPDEIYTCR